ncbi:unnamed protein product [Pseudo-nitzschia multistriata]|uniref:Uncharacterized protein n=1 Tax=Pseudo-nitzschia multistriata TaxID=183589 RepID=A0A448Z5M2_9STRA|nr:unnamed protein product [Pseudo-nitzschia multistriata]
MTATKPSSLQQALMELPDNERTLSRDNAESPKGTYSRSNSSNSLASSKKTKGRYCRTTSSNSISSSKNVLRSSRSSSSLQKEVVRMNATSFLEQYEEQAESRGKIRL